MKSRSFFSGLALLMLLNLLVKPVWIFGIDRQVQNLAGYEAFGAYFAVFGLSVVLVFIADAGLSAMMNRRLAGGEELNLPALLALKVLLAGVYLAVLLGVAWLSGLWYWNLLLLVAGIQVVSSFFLFFRNILTAHQYFTLDAFFSVLDKLLMIAICALFLYAPSRWGLLTIERFLGIQLSVSLLAMGMAAAIAWRKGWLKASQPFNWKKGVGEAAPFLLIILLMGAHYRLDGFLLERLHTDGALQAGIYASAYRLLDAANMVGYLAASFLVPFIARNKASAEVVNEAVLNVRHGLLFYGTAAACFCLYFAPWIQSLLYHTNSTYNSRVLQWCLLSLPGYLLVHIYGSVLTAKGELKTFIRILVLSVALNTGLNLFLLPVHGAWGACLAAVASQYTCGFLCYFAATPSTSLISFLKSFAPYGALALALTLFFELARGSMLNVWLILALAALATGLFLATQITFIKRFFIRIS